MKGPWRFTQSEEHAPARSHIVKSRFSRNAAIMGSMMAVFLMIISSFSVLAADNASVQGGIHIQVPGSFLPSFKNGSTPIAHPQTAISGQSTNAYTGQVSMLLTFRLNNQTRLNTLLSNLYNKNSTQYHQFLTRKQFAMDFSTSSGLYKEAVSYFNQFSGVSVRKYADRVSLSVSGPASSLGAAFNTTFVSSSSNPGIYHASSSPELPTPIGKDAQYMTGLTNQPANISLNLGTKPVHSVSAVNRTVGAYPSPIQGSSRQLIYGSDTQVAYGEQTLLNMTYPTNEVIATILWSGQNSSGQNVGPFYPKDIYQYYNATLPSYEPHAHVHGVPVNDAPKPGISSTYDNTGASMENTLDLEMAGSSAPGSNIYNVYGPNGSFYNINSALAYILNPNSTYSALNNVSVITNSWGSGDQNNTTWYNYMQEASARGISVLASSGDSGDNNNSSKHVGGLDNLWYPASMAYNNFGVTAVGGTTLTVNSNLHIKNQTAWYISSSDKSNGGPAGSTGGISTVFNETSWQKNTEANSVIQGRGRGVPDISAIANNTIVYETHDGVSYDGGSNGYYIDWGTSIASPLMAGMVAEIDAVMHLHNQSDLGYLNPTIYRLGNEQVQTYTLSSTHGYYPQGTYNSTLPMLPFYDVVSGNNYLYNATYGYDLVTGWGSINAYNFTNYVLNTNFSSNPYALKGVRDNLTLKGLKVTSYIYSGGNNVTNTQFNASIQQNFVVANELGAPIYWVQNVVYINGSRSTGWVVNYTGWVIFPFYGQYPSQPVYEYNYPMGKIIHMPHTFNVTSWISNLTEKGKQTMNFEVNSHKVTLPVPGAAYIIGEHNYKYAYNGKNYTNGPYPSMTLPGGLDPQFGLVGGPSLGVGYFQKPTAGYLNTSLQPVGRNTYTKAHTAVYNYSRDQTGEQARNLLWSSTGTSSWDLSLKGGSPEQGVLSYVQKQYSFNISEYGLPAGTTWSVVTANGTYSSTTNNMTLSLHNGTYTLLIGKVQGYYADPGRVVVTISGPGQYLPVAFVPPVNQTYIKAKSTISMITGITRPGVSLNLSAVNNQNYAMSGPLSMAIDPSANLLFETSLFSYNISAYSLSGFSKVGEIHFTKTSYPGKLVYDSATGYLYTITGGKYLDAINTSTFKTVWKSQIPDAVPNILFGIRTMDSGSKVVLLNSAGNMSIFNSATGSLVKSLKFSEVSVSAGLVQELDFHFAVVGGNLYSVNASADMLVIMNMTTYHVTSVSLSSGYNPSGVFRYGGSGNVMISGTQSTWEYYNTSSSQLSSMQKVNGSVLSVAYDPFTGYQYAFYFNPYAKWDNIAVLDPVSHTTVTTAAASYMTVSMVFDSSSQVLYTGNLYSATITAFTVTKVYTVTFTDSGMPAGNVWYVNITGGASSGPINSGTYTIQLRNGTYSYSAGTRNPDYTAQGGKVVVDGSPVSRNVVFSGVEYSVTVHESGLPAGVKWSITLANGTTVSSTTASITLHEMNGTHIIKGDNLTAYYTGNTSDMVTVDGAPAQAQVDYTHYAYITGTVAPGNANVRVNGNAVSVSNGKFNISEIKGEYNVTVSLSGYHSYNKTFNLTPDQVMKLSINLSRINTSVPPSKSPNSPDSPLIYAAAGGIGIAVVGASVGLWLRRRR